MRVREEKEKKTTAKAVKISGGNGERDHLFPYRTQKLSLSAQRVLGWRRPGRVCRRRILNLVHCSQRSAVFVRKQVLGRRPMDINIPP